MAKQKTLFHVTAEQVEAAEAQILEHSKRIEFFLTDYSVELLAKKMQDGEFEIPPYQRADTWEDERKSRFIESLLMGLSIPFLFFWERPDGKLEIVDGSQRLRTIQQFLLGDLVVGPLEQLSELEGLKFADLPESRQRKIRNRSIRGIVLNEHAEEQARFDIFERINTGPKVANAAEVRRGALTGQFMTMVIELAKNEDFVLLAPAKESAVNKREREELVTRFFAYSDGLDGYKDKPALFLFDYSKRANALLLADPALEAEYRQRFLTMIAFVQRNFPLGFRKTAKALTTRRVRFEALAVGTWLAIKANPSLADADIDVSEWIDGHEFGVITRSDSANPIKKLEGRINFVRDKLLEAANGAD